MIFGLIKRSLLELGKYLDNYLDQKKQGGRGLSRRGNVPFSPAVEQSFTRVSSPTHTRRVGCIESGVGTSPTCIRPPAPLSPLREPLVDNTRYEA